MNSEALWLSIPFSLSLLTTMVFGALTAINNWTRAVPSKRLAIQGNEPPVAVIIPTCGEPVAMVAKTANTVLAQDWPHDSLRLIVSDDGHSAAVADLVARLKEVYPAATVLYHEPPRHSQEWRHGDAKAGNLNSALTLVDRHFPDVAFIETRDADDEVGDPRFLRHCVGQLQADDTVAFVQTIKEARVREGDPFDNMESLFYRRAMPARYAANAAFPCGSGLVWRRAALAEIGRFPTWNLVEDLQSGVEALRRGWRGVYLPIVGAIAQHAPEDIPGVYKQRGTWALDTMRLLFWGNLRGLNLRQRMQFAEMGLFYLHSIALLTFLVCVVITMMFRIYPLRAYDHSFAIRFWPYVFALEVFLVALNGPQPYGSIWRKRQMALGLAPVYAKACIVALLSDPSRKPIYRVTRKVDEFAWYWRETMVHMLFLLLIVGTLLYRLVTRQWFSEEFDQGLVFWALIHITLLAGFVRKSWFGLDWRGRMMEALQHSSNPCLTLIGGERDWHAVGQSRSHPQSPKRSQATFATSLKSVGRGWFAHGRRKVKASVAAADTHSSGLNRPVPFDGSDRRDTFLKRFTADGSRWNDGISPGDLAPDEFRAATETSNR